MALFSLWYGKISVSLQQFLNTKKNEKSNILFAPHAASVIGASAQGSATTAQNPQDVDVLYAKNLLAVGTRGPSLPCSQEGNMDGIRFLATWCPPCKGEMPDIQKLYEEYGTHLSMLRMNGIFLQDMNFLRRQI